MTRLYKLTKPAFKTHYDLVSDGKNYFIDINTKPFSPKTPALTFYLGTDKSGTAIGGTYRPAFTETFKLAFGDPFSDQEPIWEDLQKTRVSVFEYKWSADLPSKIEEGRNERRTFIWKRTKTVAVDGSEPLSWSQRNWKLVEEGQDTVLAVFTAERSIGKCGTLQISVDWEGLEEKVVMTLVSMYHRTMQGGG